MGTIRTTIATLIVAALAACGTSSSPTARPATASPTPTEAASPSPTATATPTPTESPTPTPSPTDESAFEDAQECENPELGYEVEYPAGWWANERVEAEDPVANITECTFFAPSEIELEPGTDDLAGVAIRFDVVESDVDRGGEILLDEETTVDGHEARIIEREPDPQPGFIQEGELIYQYVITLEGGDELVATTDTINQEEAAYEESKPILDAMMGTIEIDD